MRQKINWKSAGKYALGLIGLAVSVAVALLFPQWYCEWKDEQITETVTLSSRENIEFLDTKSLDIAGRMKLLSEAEKLDWMEYGEIPFSSEQEVDEFLDRCITVTEKWGYCGLLPERCSAWISEENVSSGCNFFVYVDNAAFQVFLLQFYSLDGELLTFVIDTELELIYYASCTSYLRQEEIAVQTGYGSFDEFVNAISTGQFPDGSKESYAELDFASVCGAQRDLIRDTLFYPELTVELQYDNFTANAYRRIVGTDAGVGFAVMLGTDQWTYVVEAVAAVNGYWEGEIDMEEIHAEFEMYADMNENKEYYDVEPALPEEKMVIIE